MTRGYAAVGLFQPKTGENVGGAMRACGVYGAALVVVSGRRPDALMRHPTDTMKAWKYIPVVRTEDIFDGMPYDCVPYDCVPVAVEIAKGARPLPRYTHPERAFYIFGPEDGSLPQSVLLRCRDVVVVPTRACMNLAASVNVVLYDRTAKAERDTPPAEAGTTEESK